MRQVRAPARFLVLKKMGAGHKGPEMGVSI